VACHAPFSLTRRLDEAVWADLCQVLTDPSSLAESLRRARQGWLRDGAQAGRWQTLERRETELRRQIDRLVDAYVAGALALEELQTRRTRLEARLTELRREIEALTAAVAGEERLEAVATQLEAFRATLARGLKVASFTRRRQIVELLIERVVVDGPAVEIRYALPLGGAPLDGGLGAHHPGDVTGMLVRNEHAPLTAGEMAGSLADTPVASR